MTLRRRATVYVGAHERVPSPGVREAGSREAPKPRLLDRMREALRLRRYSPRTEESSMGEHGVAGRCSDEPARSRDVPTAGANTHSARR